MQKDIKLIVILILGFIAICFSPFAQQLFCCLTNLCGEGNKNYLEFLNVLFTGLASGGLVLTLFLQWKDIHDTKKELSIDRFQSSFFALLSQHNELIPNLDIKHSKGRAAFNYLLYGDFRKDNKPRTLKYTILSATDADMAKEGISDFFSRDYEELYNVYPFFLGGYFKSLFKLFQFIDKQNFCENYKKDFSDIVKSQFFDDELVLLFIFGLTQRGKSYKSLIEKYSLLNNMPDIFNDEVKSLYDKNAYE